MIVNQWSSSPRIGAGRPAMVSVNHRPVVGVRSSSSTPAAAQTSSSRSVVSPI